MIRRDAGQRFGPGFLVAAAFIGPGTVTTASLAGAQHGFALTWAVVAMLVLALVGTTVVPYNLFLHASRCRCFGFVGFPR